MSELATIPASLILLTTQQLRSELAAGLTLTAQAMTRMAGVWAELVRRGEDLSDLPGVLPRSLSAIAAGRLAAESVVAFASRPNVLRALDGMPLDQQREYAAGKQIAVIDPANPDDETLLPLQAIPAASLPMIFDDGRVRPPVEQRMAIRPRKRPQKSRPYRYQPQYDPATGTVAVGKMALRLDDLLATLAAAQGPDRPPATDVESDYVTVRLRLSKEEFARYSEHCRRAGLPDFEMGRKAVRAFGLLSPITEGE